MSSFRSYLLTAPLIVLATIVFGTAALLVSFFEHSGRAQIRLARQWSRVLLLVSSVKVQVDGIDKIIPSGSYVFASNHLSYMDTPVALANIPVEFRFLAKKGLFKIPFLGYHLARAGHISVPRGDPRAAVKTLSTAAEAIRERGISLLIFPEGGRSRDGRLHDFKEGAAYIAIKAGVPIVPVALVGTQEVLPFGAGTVLPGKVSMCVGDPIPTAGLSLRDRGKLTAQVHDQISLLLNPNSVRTHA
ncbi:MAG: 1-acyl-sn-glycerol-3-phosphate acyltransferase [Acidobacteriota bacterium]|nr:1-acyl-sn-glycerol-3-phosphate acyltransferase [Acidobacteriota bacterium]